MEMEKQKTPRSHVEVSLEEQLLILRSYAKNKCNWPAVYTDVKSDLYRLPERARQLYLDSKYDKIKRRMSDQVAKLMTKNPELIQNDEVKELVKGLCGEEKRYSRKAHPLEKKARCSKKKTDSVNLPVEQGVEARREAAIPLHVSGDELEQGAEQVAEQQAEQVAEQQAEQVAEQQAEQVAEQQTEQVDEQQAEQGGEGVQLDEAVDEIQPKKRKTTSDLAREAYEKYLENMEGSKKIKEKMDKCMDKFLSM